MGFECNGTLDIECADWDSFAVAATYDDAGPRIWYDGDEMIDHLRVRGGVHFAHAGGVYDLLWVLERARARRIPCQVDRSQHRVTRIVMGSLTLRDSYAIWPVPLDDICGALGRPVPRLPWACICPRKCGGFCQIGQRAKDGDPDLEDYVIADARALYDGIHWLKNETGKRGIELRGTLGQTAWVAAQTELGLPDSDLDFPMWRKLKPANKGGRIAIIRPRAVGPGSHHDICNAYPASLAAAELPVGSMRELGDRRAEAALENMRPGIYTLTVRVPDDCFLPPLPWTCSGALTFPTGVFSGSWVLPELLAAFARGVTIERVQSALIWEATAPIFRHLLDRWYGLRREVGRKTPLGQWIGRWAKALSGKLAERPERSRTVLYPESIKVCPRIGACRNGCTKRCGAYDQLDLAGKIWGVPYSHIGASCFPHWSAYLRAMTRVQWLEQAEAYGPDELCMGNTDSLWTLGRRAPDPLGDGLGQWEYQHAWHDLEVRAPTVYAFRYEPGGPLQIRGVPHATEADWRRGQGVLDRGIVTLGAAVKSTKGLFRKRVRRWSLPSADRVWYGDRRMGAGGITYPADARELREIAERAKLKREARRGATP